MSCLAVLISTIPCFAQSEPPSPYYSRGNSFGVFTAYSNDSSHILLGASEDRKLLEFGVSYSRRLLQNRIVTWQYDGELLPVALESDPVLHVTEQELLPVPGAVSSFSFIPYAACHAGSGIDTYTLSGVVFSFKYVNTCGRQWTIGEGMSPVGFRWNFTPRRRWQPLIEGHGGYMYSTQPIPVLQAGNFNFTFDMGAGVEIFRPKRAKSQQSVRAEYRYHHISNHDTAGANPGIDNGVIQVTYVFGR